MIELQMNKQLVKQVAKVIGKKLAKHELSIVDAGGGLVFTHADTVHLAFIWSETPQGEPFWCDINLGKWPYNYKRGK
jgi:diaminopimelate decarboxylase